VNPSAIVVLIISLVIFIGGIAYCISRVGKTRAPDKP
jgi:hypothetical protein